MFSSSHLTLNLSNAPVVVGLFTIVCLLWIERRSKFNGPHIDWDLLNEANEEE